MMINYIDLCSGAGGGFPLAAAKLREFKPIALCEKDEFCKSILSKRYKKIPIVSDINKFPPIEGAELITASPPCQPFSIQGLRMGEDDSRDCMPAVITAIAQCKPKYFIIENVPGLLNCKINTKSNESYFQHLLQQIHQIRYNAEWLCVSSGHFNAPFFRERLLLVGISHSIKYKKKPAPWIEQARFTIEKIKDSSKGPSCKAGMDTKSIWDADNLAKSIGTKTGDRVVRRQRCIAGNMLDPRVAAIGLERILHLKSVQ